MSILKQKSWMGKRLSVMLGLSVMGLGLMTGQPARAQTSSGTINVNDAANQPQPGNFLNKGSNLTINDLFRAAELLDTTKPTSVDQSKSLDKAITQFNQTRQRPLQIGPASLSETTPAKTP